MHPVQGSCREKSSCVNGKDAPELSFLCRPGESDTHFFESKLNVWKSHAGRDQFPCKHKVGRWWQGSTRAQRGPKLGCAIRGLLGCKCLAEWGAGVVARCHCGGDFFSISLPLKEWIPVSVRVAAQSWAVKGSMNVAAMRAKFPLL